MSRYVGRWSRQQTWLLRTSGFRRMNSSTNNSLVLADHALVLNAQDKATPAIREKLELVNVSEIKVLSSMKGPSLFPFRIRGDESQSVEVTLDPGNGVRAETGSLIYMTDGVEMETSMGNLKDGVARYMTGESFFVSDFNNNGSKVETVSFSASHPSKILPFHLTQHGGALIAQKGAFLVGAKDTDIQMYFTQSFKAGFFGGEGFILQKISGRGLALLKGGGAVTMHDLKSGEVLRVSPGSLVAFEESVTYDAEMLKKMKNIIFAGEGLFLARMQGPGKVWIQTLPFSRLVDSIAYSVARAGYGNSGFLPGVMMGGMMGGHGSSPAEGGAGDVAASGAAEAGGVASSGATTAAAGAAAGGGNSWNWGGNEKEEAATEEEDNGDDDDGGDDGEGGGSGWFSNLYGMAKSVLE